MASEINLEITTPSRVIYKAAVASVTVPGTEGSFQVLFNHAPLISTLEIGLIKVKETAGKEIYFASGGGTVEVKDNNVLILADSLESVENIDVDRAESAKQRAKERLARKSEEKIDVARAESALARSVNRIKIAEKYKKRESV